MKRAILSLLVGAGALAHAQSAHANHHLMSISEVFAGTALKPNASYIELQMYAMGQNVLSQHTVQVFDAAGVSVLTAKFPGNVGSGANQATVLLATADAQTLFNVTPDLVLTAPISAAGGKVCFESIDCVAWGNYTGSATGVGKPALPASGIPAGKALQRNLKGNGLLEAGDDTDDSATDFQAGTPTPRNNAGTTGTIPTSTCGNDVVEGLEACDDDAGCKADCSAAYCGDAATAANEECDDGNSLNTDACKNDCSAPECGDGVKSTGEACDDGNAVNVDACKNDCSAPVCGDSIVSSGEQCDDGNTDESDACSSACTLKDCGDGTTQTGEECDDGNVVAGDGCAASCELEFCGDGMVNNAGKEACDDANQVDGDACWSDCTLTPGSQSDAGTGGGDGDDLQPIDPCQESACDGGTGTTPKSSKDSGCSALLSRSPRARGWWLLALVALAMAARRASARRARR
ncbi:MAG: DUF4215 domain-containing protein [Myxococcales bacterium]